MGKMKTKKSVVKRFRLTRNKKMIHRASGQDHFNARERGNTTRNKRTDRAIAPTQARTLIRAI